MYIMTALDLSRFDSETYEGFTTIIDSGAKPLRETRPRRLHVCQRVVLDRIYPRSFTCWRKPNMTHRTELLISFILATLYSCKLMTATAEDRCPEKKYITATDTPQNLTSPGYPGYYIRPSSCQWIIQSDENGVIEFEIIKFELQGSQSCFRDYLSVREGPWRYGPKLITWCGIKPRGRRFKTAGNMATVLFQAVTNGGDFPGFAIQYWQAKNGVLPDGERKYTIANYILGAIFGVFLIATFVTLLVLVVVRNIKYSRERHHQHIRIYS